MKEIGKWVFHMEKVNCILKMELYMKVSLLMDKYRDRMGSIFSLMAQLKEEQ
jgi:hypothetical protein